MLKNIETDVSLHALAPDLDCAAHSLCQPLAPREGGNQGRHHGPSVHRQLFDSIGSLEPNAAPDHIHIVWHSNTYCTVAQTS